jgi:hypothetical protein
MSTKNIIFFWTQNVWFIRYSFITIKCFNMKISKNIIQAAFIGTTLLSLSNCSHDLSPVDDTSINDRSGSNGHDGGDTDNCAACGMG